MQVTLFPLRTIIYNKHLIKISEKFLTLWSSQAVEFFKHAE